MNFEFEEEHRILRDSVREFAEKEIMPYGKEYDEKESTRGKYSGKLRSSAMLLRTFLRNMVVRDLTTWDAP